jgi:TolA-binding protein
VTDLLSLVQQLEEQNEEKQKELEQMRGVSERERGVVEELHSQISDLQSMLEKSREELAVLQKKKAKRKAHLQEEDEREDVGEEGRSVGRGGSAGGGGGGGRLSLRPIDLELSTSVDIPTETSVNQELFVSPMQRRQVSLTGLMTTISIQYCTSANTVTIAHCHHRMFTTQGSVPDGAATGPYHDIDLEAKEVRAATDASPSVHANQSVFFRQVGISVVISVYLLYVVKVCFCMSRSEFYTAMYILQ